MMKYLYIIGNGFDLFTGLHTKYADFKRWLEVNYPFVYENMEATYDINGEWWNDFEEQLGKLDIKKYVKRFSQINKIAGSRLNNIGDDEQFKLLPPLNSNSPCANRLRGLLDILQYCFERWIDDCQREIVDPQYTNIECTDSFFINFNYTDILQNIYKIPDERVLHIHGRASNHERLIFGHDSHPFGGKFDNYDEDRTCFELFRYTKNPYEQIFKHNELVKILKNVSTIYIYGFSISPVDEDYLDWIEKHTPSDSEWEFSWYTELDKTRIHNFLHDHQRIENRYHLIQL